MNTVRLLWENDNSATLRIETATAVSLLWQCDFFSPQNGQTALLVAEGASHQDVVDLMKAHVEGRASELSSNTDLPWATLTMFTSSNHPKPFSLLNSQSSIKEGKQLNQGYKNINHWEWGLQQCCGHSFPSHLCHHACEYLWMFCIKPLQITKQSNSQIYDKTLPQGRTQYYRGDMDWI